MSSQKILVLGATGYIGSATVKTLANLKANVTAGVRDPSKAKELQDSGSKVIKADMSQSQAELARILSNYTSVYLVTPGHIDRTQITINAIQAAKQANVQYLLVVSVTCADNQDVLFGRQFNPIEKELKASGLKYGILRLPIFTDNVWGNNEPIRTHNTFYGPINGNKKFVTVAVQDAALAAAVILQNPSKHIGKTYTITSDYKSSDEQAQAFSQALGRQIKYVNATFEGTKQALLKFMPEWQVDGVLELYKLIEKNDTSQVNHTNDFKQITGSQQTTNLNWMWQNFKAF
ncbi:Trk system potassium uptake protein TrkA, amine-terminal domain protein (macronuclear) [Tetrahymena thermophila SB210]|uniref:Trk system potassium uptake protein TrkA, amine-terminal domain protein n=1 Tax=Tetrahymena thermophila (strain SB210) TaxID=312017 RepID=Q23Q88_TETTS|nr:Trk system potassium uptake protein TrkA, amine-terminal domain protein [Tetrahymena thermophila SB210]EAR98696.1 Trk system potassium uptake protein TrkA, amine-terminal domain protein [Tetrahymena thermophila SB210]|eukprot:XP_001018941.1 Trk system potassium uptake protein TrkA, amine-terminal domain protein [Tetrahymena thermophila SB210]